MNRYKEIKVNKCKTNKLLLILINLKINFSVLAVYIYFILYISISHLIFYVLTFY
jgi:hypothetical protein